LSQVGPWWRYCHTGPRQRSCCANLGRRFC